jgi:cephalosporin-C deacetylase-like acetyl esterase
MSWPLWLLGHADTAITRMDAAIQRADAISHPHSHAYACYYASILHALRGELLVAQGHAERCLTLSEEHGFRHWRGLAHAAIASSAAALSSFRSTHDRWGYVSLAVDSFATRGIKDACTQPTPALMLARQGDALGALSYLSNLPFVDPQRIAIMGASQAASSRSK